MTPEQEEIKAIQARLPAWVTQSQSRERSLDWWREQDRKMQSVMRFKPVTLEEARRQAKNHQ